MNGSFIDIIFEAIYTHCYHQLNVLFYHRLQDPVSWFFSSDNAEMSAVRPRMHSSNLRTPLLSGI